jgi:hypothetical protein
MTNEKPPLWSVPMDPVESRGSAVNPPRTHRGTGARALQAPSETARLAPVDPWKDSRVTSRYEPESNASYYDAEPTVTGPKPSGVTLYVVDGFWDVLGMKDASIFRLHESEVWQGLYRLVVEVVVTRPFEPFFASTLYPHS